jgi:Flp pilus assembly protein TadD
MRHGQRGAFLVALLIGLMLLPACKKTFEQNYAKGLESMKSGKYELAREQLQRAYIQNPASIEAKYQLALAEIKLQDQRSAYSLLREAEEKDRAGSSVSIPIRIELAKLFMSTKQYEQAQKRLLWVLAKDSHNRDAHTLLATTLASLAQPEAAKEQVDLLLADDPRSLEGRLLDATLHLAAKEGQQAEASLQEEVTLTQRSTDSLVALANFYQLTRQPPKALELLKEIVKREPQNIAVRMKLGWIYAQMGDRATAEKTFREIAQSAAATQPASMALANYYVTNSDWPKAAAEVESLAKKNTDPKLRETLAALYYRASRRDDAKKLAEQLIREKKGDASAHLLLGLLHLDAHEYEPAIAEFDDVLHDQSDSASAEYLLGLASFGAGKEQVAAQQMEHTLQLNNEMLPARLWLMDYHLKRGSNEVALNLVHGTPPSQASAPDIVIMTALCNPLADLDTEQQAKLQRALILRPRLILTYLDLGMTTLLRKYGAPLREQLEGIVAKNPEFLPAEAVLEAVLEAQGKQDQALAQAQKRVTANPKSTADLLALAKLQIKGGDLKAARATLGKAAAVEPENAEVLVRMAEVEANSGYMTAAQQHLETLTQRYPQSPAAWSFKGILYQQSGSAKEARGCYEQALKLDSRDAVAANNLGLLLATSFKDPSHGLELARKAHTIDPTNPEISDTLGWIQYLSGNYSDAVEAIGEAVRRKPDEASFRYHLGMAQSQTGRDKEALASLGMALRLNPNMPEAESIKTEMGKIVPRTVR